MASPKNTSTPALVDTPIPAQRAKKWHFERTVARLGLAVRVDDVVDTPACVRLEGIGELLKRREMRIAAMV